MSQYEIESRWITPDGIAGVAFRFGDIVRLKKAEFSDELFVVIALVSLSPTPMFGVTSPDEKYVTALQEELESTGRSTGRKLIIKKPGEKPSTNA
jgi:hypothetical protein